MFFNRTLAARFFFLTWHIFFSSMLCGLTSSDEVWAHPRSSLYPGFNSWAANVGNPKWNFILWFSNSFKNSHLGDLLPPSPFFIYDWWIVWMLKVIHRKFHLLRLDFECHLIHSFFSSHVSVPFRLALFSEICNKWWIVSIELAINFLERTLCPELEFAS